MISTFRALTAIAFVALATSPALAGPVKGDFDVHGNHSVKGAYSGTAKVSESNGTVSITAASKLAANGENVKWTATGKRTGDKIELTFVLKGNGIVGGIFGNLFGKKTGKGTYVVSPDGKTITGSWKLDQGDVSGKETLTLKSAAPTPPAVTGFAAFVVAGKELKEAVVPQRVLPGQSDLIDLKLRKQATAPAGAFFTVTVGGASVELYRDAGLTQRVGPAERLANGDVTLKVKGCAPTKPGEPVVCSVTLKDTDGNVLSNDTPKVHVTRSIFHLSGHGGWERAERFKKWIKQGRVIDTRTNPPVFLGKDQKTGKPVYYSFYGTLENNEAARVALSTEGSIVAYHGHSNFGLGYAFEVGYRSINQFFNIADPQCPVNWQYLREHQEHPDLMFDDKEYADDPTTPEFSDPVRVGRIIQGKLNNYETARYPATGAQGGERVRLTRNPTKKYLDHHYGSEENWRIVIKAGSADMPEKRWSKLLLLSCYSGQYYFDSFGGRGTLFYTHDEAWCASVAGSVFLESLVQGKTDDQILADMNKVQNVHDYHKFGDE